MEVLGAGDVARHQVGRELDPCEAHRGNLRERAGDQRLGQAREVLEENVSVGKDAEQDELEEIGRASCRERGVDLGGRRIIKKKKRREMWGEQEYTTVSRWYGKTGG